MSFPLFEVTIYLHINICILFQLGDTWQDNLKFPYSNISCMPIRPFYGLLHRQEYVAFLSPTHDSSASISILLDASPIDRFGGTVRYPCHQKVVKRTALGLSSQVHAHHM